MPSARLRPSAATLRLIAAEAGPLGAAAVARLEAGHEWFRAHEPHPLTTTLDPRYLRTDESLGWDAFCADLEVVRVPGDHLSMIDPPHVEVVAAALAARLGAPKAARP